MSVFIIKNRSAQLKQKKDKMSHTRSISNTLAAINNSPLNTSKSKAMFSFTKANRFTQNKQAGQISAIIRSQSLYNKPSCLSKRSTSFGYGSKVDLINKYMNTPSPDKYTKVSEFQPTKRKGVSLGLGRDDCKNVSIFRLTKHPAPTDYNCKDNKENSAAYTIGARVKLPELFPQKISPGPGKYYTEKIEKQNGSCFLSKFKSSISFKIPSKSPRIVEKVNCPALGPLTYNTDIPSTGKQLLSKKKTEKSFYFDKKPRETMKANNQNPGPGAYGTVFSQFNR